MDRHSEHHLHSRPPPSSTLQITSAVDSGAQIITLCYFSSHTLLLKTWLLGCPAASALIASRHAIDPTPLLRIWMGGGGGLMGCGGSGPGVCPIRLCRFPKARANQYSSMSDNGHNMHIELQIEMCSLQTYKLRTEYCTFTDANVILFFTATNLTR